MKRFFKLLENNKSLFLVTLLVGIIYSGINVALPTFSGELINSFLNTSGMGKESLLLFLCISILDVILYSLDHYMNGIYNLYQTRLMRGRVFNSFIKGKMGTREETGKVVSFINNDLPIMVQQYFCGTIDIIKCVCIIIFSAFSMIYIHWILAVVIIGISVSIVLLPQLQKNTGKKARKNYSDALACYNTSLDSMIEGKQVIKTYKYQNRAVEIQERNNTAVLKRSVGMMRIQTFIMGSTGFLQVLKTVLILILGIILISKGYMNVGELIAVIQLGELIGAPMEVLSYFIHGRNEVEPLVKDYEDFYFVNEEKREDTKFSRETPSKIVMRDVCCSFESLNILEGINVCFEAGKKYLITGESGSGKSTMLRLLSKTGDLDYKGQILYGNTEIKDVSDEQYYDKVCPVFQDPYLFYASLEENVLLGRDISKERYYEVIEKLNLGYLLKRFEGREITAEMVEQLSGGERQRVALARAMVGKPAIYLLDEVTSALDAENSELIEKVLLEEKATIIHVSHKPNPGLLSLYDERYVLRDGKLQTQ